MAMAAKRGQGFRARSALTLASVAALSALFGAAAASAEPRAIVELFTSQGCSSCPPADRLIGELGSDPSIIALSFPIDYWDYLGWKDTLAQPKFTARQRGYAHRRGDREVYTPQAVVNGMAHALGSDRAEIVKTIAQTQKTASVMSVPVSMAVGKNQIDITVPAAALAATPQAEVWICGVSREVYVNVGRGENRGREIGYHNVVRRWLKVGDWTGRAGVWSVPLENIRGDDVDSAVVYVQDGTRDKPGIMFGAAQASLK
jgi:hypothetical protein